MHKIKKSILNEKAFRDLELNMYTLLAWVCWILSVIVYASTNSVFLGTIIFMLGCGFILASQERK